MRVGRKYRIRFFGFRRHKGGRPDSTGRDEPANSRLEQVSATAAHISQVLMLIVVVFGYVFTIRPAFQNELLSEEVARLKLEERRAEEALNRLEVEVSARQDELSALVLERSRLEASIESLRNDNVEVQLDLERAVERFKYAQQEVKRYEEALIKTKEKVYELLKAQLTGSAPIPIAYYTLLQRPSHVGIFDTDEMHKVASRIREWRLQPIELARQTLGTLESIVKDGEGTPGNEIENELLDDYRRGIEANSENLLCDPVEPEVWQQSFVSDVERIDAFLPKCVDHHLYKNISEEGWNRTVIEEIRRSDDWRPVITEYESACRVSIRFAIERFYTDRLGEAHKACRERLFNVNAIVMGDRKDHELPPFVGLEPPTADEVDERVRDMINDW